jgi:hypothetical protein
MIPNYILVGAMKAGTTKISSRLAQHPQIFVTEPKEPCFFLYQGGNPYELELTELSSLDYYLSLFEKAQGNLAIGEASPYYLSCFHCAEAIYKFNPSMKILIVLRNPLHRAFSAYRYWHQDTSHHLSQEDFIDAFMTEGLVKFAERGRRHRIGWMKDIGFYSKHLKRYLDVFPRDNVKVVFYDELVKSPETFFEGIFDFLGVPHDGAGAELDSEKVNVTYEAKYHAVRHLLNKGYDGAIVRALKKTPIGSTLRGVRSRINSINKKEKAEELTFPSHRYGELIEVYREDIEALEAMTCSDLGGWRTGSML